VLENGQLKHTYEFSPLNRLTKSTNATGQAAGYDYNGLGFRVGKQVSDKLNPTKNINYVLDLTRQYHNLLQLTEDGHSKNYTWDVNVVSESGDEGSRFYLQDDLGSPLRFTAADGTPVESYAYDEFGNDLTGNQGKAQPFGFTGYQYDNVAQTYFAQAREYVPGVGRFAGRDIVKGMASAPFTLNEYAYCWNSPLVLVDRSGMFSGYFQTPTSIWNDALSKIEYNFNKASQAVNDWTSQAATDVRDWTSQAATDVRGFGGQVATTAKNIGNGVTNFWNTNIYGEEEVIVYSNGSGANKTTTTATNKSDQYTGSIIVKRIETVNVSELVNTSLTINVPFFKDAYGRSWGIGPKSIGVSIGSSGFSIFGSAGIDLGDSGSKLNGNVNYNTKDIVRLTGKASMRYQDTQTGYGASLPLNPFSFAQAYKFVDTKAGNISTYSQVGVETRMAWVYAAVAVAYFAPEILAALGAATPALAPALIMLMPILAPMIEQLYSTNFEKECPEL
jgi:RHS repeat-associated protein